MTDEEYHATVEALKTISGLLMQMDLVSVRDRMERADTLGPVLDPTLYRQSMDGLKAQRVLVDAGLAYQRAVHRAVAVAAERRR